MTAASQQTASPQQAENTNQPASSVVAENNAGGSLLNAMTEPRLYAGKYKTIEELEEGYRNAAGVYNENESLKLQFAVPEQYQAPTGVLLREAELNDLKSLAKRSGLSQNQFNNMTLEMSQHIKYNIDSLESAKQALGPEKLNLVTDYVKQNYPASLQETVINKLLKDGNAMSDALKDRDQKLNSSVPGMRDASTSIPQPAYDGFKELEKASLEYRQNPNERNRNLYISLAQEVGESRGLGKKE